MIVALLAAVSAALLFVDPNITAVHFDTFPNWNFWVALLTYQLDHANLQHFVGNYMFMAPYGIYLERKLGRLNFLLFFLICGVMSAVIFWASTPHSVGMIGSSGSAFGVFTAACLAYNEKAWQRWAGFIWIGVVLGLQLMYAFNPDPWNMVAYWGHLGGAAAGAVLAYYFIPYRPKPAAPKKSLFQRLFKR